jgi:Ca2+-binding EF-hand superfamily protein
MDVDGTGKLDASDIVRALGSIKNDSEPMLTHEQAQALLDEFDMSRTGKLDLHEFSQMMMEPSHTGKDEPKEAKEKEGERPKEQNNIETA